MFTLLSVASFASVVSLALAGPLVDRQSTCRPNFQGQPLSVVTSNVNDPSGPNPYAEWSVASPPIPGSQVALRFAPREALLSGEFLMEFTGQPTNTYRIKLVADTNRYLSAFIAGDGHLTFTTLQLTNPLQEFAIDCSSCGADPIVARNCVISSPATNSCVTADLNNLTNGQLLSVARCDGRAGQNFQIVQGLSQAQLTSVNI